jgi:peptide/nickel transport system substrate-binding protein
MMARLAQVLLAGLSALLLATAAQAQSTLKIVMHADLKVIDPIWVSLQISRTHGYMIYDTLFGLDSNLKPKPQMVDRYEVSPDGLVYTFVLRDGLVWSDGAPVKAEDCVASLNRWGSRDAMGQKLLANIKELVALDDKTIRLTLSGPYALVLESLAKPGGLVPFMMPKRIADTPSSQQIKEWVGSGPFLFKGDEWKPGEKTVYVKNPTYKPRPEPASYFAGGKVAKLDRVEWVALPDTQTAVSALLAGEIDAIESVTPDLLPLIEKNKSIEVVRGSLPSQYTMRPNWLNPPLDNPKIREAIGYALNQVEFLDAVVGDSRYYRVCKTYFVCGTEYASDAGVAGRLEGNAAKARELLKEAGYDGTPLVLLQPTDVAVLANLAPVAKAQLERAGFKVDMQSMDWQTQAARSIRREPLNQGGWSLLTGSWGALDLVNPIVTSSLNASCDKAAPGWPCDTAIEELRDRFAREADPAKRKAIAGEIQTLAVKAGTHWPLGEWYSLSAYSTKIKGNTRTPAATTFWNMEKAAR